MPVTSCPPGQWTTISDTGGSMLLTAESTGFMVSTSASDTLGTGFPLGPCESMVIGSGITVRVQPIAPVTVNAKSMVI